MLNYAIYRLGERCPKFVIGSGGTKFFNVFRKNYPHFCFYPEKYGLTTQFGTSQKRLTEQHFHDINAAFVAGVISTKKDVICCAYLGAMRYRELVDAMVDSKKGPCVGTLGEVGLLIVAGYKFSPLPFESEVSDENKLVFDLVKQSFVEHSGSVPVFGLLTFDNDRRHEILNC